MRGSSKSSAAQRALNVATQQSCLVSFGWHFSPGSKQRPQLFPVTEPKLFTFPSSDLPLPLKGRLNRPLENRRRHRCHKDKKFSLYFLPSLTVAEEIWQCFFLQCPSCNTSLLVVWWVCSQMDSAQEQDAHTAIFYCPSKSAGKTLPPLWGLKPKPKPTWAAVMMVSHRWNWVCCACSSWIIATREQCCNDKSRHWLLSWWPGFCEELVNIFRTVNGLLKIFLPLLWPVLEGRWIFPLITTFKLRCWIMVEGSCRRKHKKAKACHPHTFVSPPEVLEFQGWVCTSCEREGLKGEWFASLCSNLLEQDSSSRAMRLWWRICPFQRGLVLTTGAFPRC